MSWMERLYETYEAARERRDLLKDIPTPPGYVMPQAHIQVTLDGDGNFKGASVVDCEPTLIPATEESAGRTSGGAPHPLCDKLQYCAGDYAAFGGASHPYFDDFESGGTVKEGYLSLLREWSNFARLPMLEAVLKYSERRRLVRDLVECGVLYADEDGKLLTSWDVSEMPQIFKVLPKKKDKTDGEMKFDAGSAMVRWKVLLPGELCTEVWKSERLTESWNEFVLSRQQKLGMCYITGKEAPVAENHPANIRFPGDKAKLISSNDTSCFTFRGRFVNAEEACTVSYDVSQKAHAALRWLLERQGIRNDSQFIVSWAVSNAKVPDICAGTDKLFEEITDDDEEESAPLEILASPAMDVGQYFALKLNKKMRGYSQELPERDDIVVMAIDSAISGKGRMSIVYYRELKGSEFLRRVEDYHKNYAWRQRFSKERVFTGAPSIKDIADSAYAGPPNAQLQKATLARLIPVVVDGAPMPFDLTQSVCRRASAPISLEWWEFEKILGIACGMYAGSHRKERDYKMSLEENYSSRDYLYGRLLAVADAIEGRALYISGENRDTSAMKLMQRFADKPAETWRQIEMNLLPYMSRLKAKRSSLLTYYNSLIDQICSLFDTAAYNDNSPLTHEFLIGFHCQRQKLWEKAAAEKATIGEAAPSENL